MSKAEVAREGKDSGVPLWINRDFLLLWSAQAISQVAQNALWFGILVLVQERSNSNVQMGIAVMTLILPSVFFGVLAGALVDRWDKRVVLVACNALRAVAMLGYLLFAHLLPVVFLINFFFSTVTQFFSPAEAAMIPAITPRSLLMRANSFFHLTFTAAQLVGLVVVGPALVKVLGMDWLFLLVAAMIALCAGLVWPLPSLKGRHEGDVAQAGVRAWVRLWEDIREVWRFVVADRMVALAMVQWTVGATLGVVVAMLAPGFVATELGVRADDAVFVLAPAGVGMLVGTAFLSRRGPRLDKQKVVNGGLFVVGVALMVLGLISPAWRFFSGRMMGDRATGVPLAEVAGVMAIIAAVTLVAGVAFVCIMVPSQTQLQERAPTEIRGRVFAVLFVLGNSFSILPLLFLGVLADVIGVGRTLVVISLIMLAVAAASVRTTSRAHALGLDHTTAA